MRPVLINDLTTAARTLLAADPSRRGPVMAQIVQNAKTADLYRKRVGRGHRLYGNGSLASACQPYAQAPLPPRCDAQYLSCLSVVISSLVAFD